MRYLWLTSAVVALGFVAACSNNGASSSGDKTSQLAGRVAAAPINYALETVADGLDHPWSLAFLPNGGMLVTERTGKLLLITPGGDKKTVYDFNLGTEYPAVHKREGGQAGMFDVVLHPNFAENKLVYISYAGKLGEKTNTLFLMRFTFADDADGPRIENGEEIFRALPDRIRSNHYGARFIFTPDGTILMPIGEAFHHREKAQDLDNHFGKTIRINDDGSVPDDNPFTGTADALPEIWTYGHRNPQGVLLTADGRVFENEHGPAGGDEINILKPGANYGWPSASYGLDYSGGRISPFEALDGTEQPLIHFTPSIAPSGFAQYEGNAFPDWRGDLFLSALALKHVRHVSMNADGSLGEQSELFGELDERFRDVRVGPDGFLYLLTEAKDGANSKILKIVPKT